MDITIRKALIEDAYIYANCHIICWQTAYKGIVPDNFLYNMSIQKEQWDTLLYPRKVSIRSLILRNSNSL